MRLLYIVLGLLFFCGMLAADSAGGSELARVGIPRFVNVERDKDYEWVEISLPEVISNSMKARFEFISQDQKLVDSAFAAANKQSANTLAGLQTWLAEDFRAEKKSGYPSATALAAVAAEAQCDILIVGKFRVDRENSRISMQALIYNAESKRFIGRVEEESDITNRVFRHIDNLASAIVSTIYQYALQANKGSSYSHLRLLVLVPAFDTTEERQRAESELFALKKELSLRTPGNYLTVFEFFTKYKVAQAEQEHALQLAQHRDRRRIKAWLERYGVTDAYLVFVSENKVNITAVSERRIAETSYPVGSDLTARRQALDKVSEKTALQKTQRTQDRHFAVHAGLSGSRGMLFSGTRIGILAGPTLHASLRLWPFFEPQFRIEGHFGFRREDFAGLAGASLLGGLGYTWNKSRFALTPYAVAGIFTAHVRTIYAQTTVLLPGVTAGAIATWYIRSHWGVSLAVSGYYISDPQAPALFYTAALSTVLRFQ